VLKATAEEDFGVLTDSPSLSPTAEQVTNAMSAVSLADRPRPPSATLSIGDGLVLTVRGCSMMPFRAQWDGVCPSCDEVLAKGDRVYSIDLEELHRDAMYCTVPCALKQWEKPSAPAAASSSSSSPAPAPKSLLEDPLMRAQANVFDEAERTAAKPERPDVFWHQAPERSCCARCNAIVAKGNAFFRFEGMKPHQGFCSRACANADIDAAIDAIAAMSSNGNCKDASNIDSAAFGRVGCALYMRSRRAQAPSSASQPGPKSAASKAETKAADRSVDLAYFSIAHQAMLCAQCNGKLMRGSPVISFSPKQDVPYYCSLKCGLGKELSTPADIKGPAPPQAQAPAESRGREYKVRFNKLPLDNPVREESDWIRLPVGSDDRCVYCDDTAQAPSALHHPDHADRFVCTYSCCSLYTIGMWDRAVAEANAQKRKTEAQGPAPVQTPASDASPARVVAVAPDPLVIRSVAVPDMGISLLTAKALVLVRDIQFCNYLMLGALDNTDLSYAVTAVDVRTKALCVQPAGTDRDDIEQLFYDTVLVHVRIITAAWALGAKDSRNRASLEDASLFDAVNHDVAFVHDVVSQAPKSVTLAALTIMVWFMRLMCTRLRGGARVASVYVD
jgi:hypothetical protein